MHEISHPEFKQFLELVIIPIYVQIVRKGL